MGAGSVWQCIMQGVQWLHGWHRLFVVLAAGVLAGCTDSGGTQAVSPPTPILEAQQQERAQETAESQERERERLANEALALLARARMEFRQSHYEMALALLKDFLRRFPDHPMNGEAQHLMSRWQEWVAQEKQITKERAERNARLNKRLREVVAARDKSENIQKLDGFGDFKFGMTVEEAHAIRGDHQLAKGGNKDCEFVGVYLCLVRKATIYGQQAVVTVQFSNEGKRLHQIAITFEASSCLSVVEIVLPKLVEIYGVKDMTSELYLNVWTFPKGGKLQLLSVCTDDQKGLVVVSYSASEAL